MIPQHNIYCVINLNEYSNFDPKTEEIISKISDVLDDAELEFKVYLDKKDFIVIIKYNTEENMNFIDDLGYISTSPSKFLPFGSKLPKLVASRIFKLTGLYFDSYARFSPWGDDRDVLLKFKMLPTKESFAGSFGESLNSDNIDIRSKISDILEDEELMFDMDKFFLSDNSKPISEKFRIVLFRNTCKENRLFISRVVGEKWLNLLLSEAPSFEGRIQSKSTDIERVKKYSAISRIQKFVNLELTQYFYYNYNLNYNKKANPILVMDFKINKESNESVIVREYAYPKSLMNWDSIKSTLIDILEDSELDVDEDKEIVDRSGKVDKFIGISVVVNIDRSSNISFIDRFKNHKNRMGGYTYQVSTETQLQDPTILRIRKMTGLWLDTFTASTFKIFLHFKIDMNDLYSN